MRDLLDAHQRIVLQFSGGKDSLACLMLCREYLHKIHVVWVNPGAPYPGIREYMKVIAESVPHFHEIAGDQPRSLAEQGYPVDVLPIWNSTFGKDSRNTEGVKVQGFVQCCNRNLWQPLAEAVAALDATLVIRGSKRADEIVTKYASGYEENGVTYVFPLEGMTDSDVMAYLDEQGAVLPDTYHEGMTSSPDCWNCTAYSMHAGEKFTHMRRHHPELWEQMRPVLKSIQTSIRRDVDWMDTVLGE